MRFIRRSHRRAALVVPLLILAGLVLLQLTMELIAWIALSAMWFFLWPVLVTIAIGAVGLVVFLKRRRFLHAGAWTVLVIIGFVGIRFALSAIGSGGVDIPAGGPIADWPAYGRDPGGLRYSPLDQINRDNVSHLEIAWKYHTGDFSDGSGGRQKTSFQATPIVVDGTLYVSTVYGKVIALDPETGVEIWTYDPKVDLSVRRAEFASRGVSSWVDSNLHAGDSCRRRIIIGTIDARLIALDAATGNPCQDFGQSGQVDLSQGVELGEHQVERRQYGVTSPPAIIGDLVVVGSFIGDNRGVTLERGVVRAFDARSGQLRWFWDAVPRDPGDPAWNTWEGDSALKTGAANVWAPISVDPVRDLVFVPTGSASPDFYGGERKGSNSYANSVVALRGSTGELVWHFQTVHHDLWDYDVPAQPTLITVRKDGEDIPAVAQATKMGFLFLLHRDTGEPIFPVEERSVPQSDVPGEESWPTQPFPTVPPPLARMTINVNDVFGLTPWDRGKCRALIERHRNEGIFTPISLRGTIQFPGYGGGTNWGSVAFDSERGLVVLNMMHVPAVVKLVPREDLQKEREMYRDGSSFNDILGTPYGLRRTVMLSPLGMPCIKPPWGTILAVDVATGEVKWEEPLGTIRDVAPIPLPFRWGVHNLGGPIVTAGGLVFIGAAADNYLRVFDVDTGEELWKGRLPASPQATPMTYRLSENGRQFVVIAAGGHGFLDTTIGDSLVAFALPEK